MSAIDRTVERNYETARESYRNLGVDTDAALERLARVPLSVHCWQGDDVRGFEQAESALGGGLQATGNHPGRARNVAELRRDLLRALSLIPGRHRVNLHAIYGEFEGRPADRDTIGLEHFSGWIDWAMEHGLKLDMNGTFFSHPLAADGFTLSSRRPEIRDFWIEHARRCRAIAAEMGRRQGSPAGHNLWIPDGAKDITLDRLLHRGLLRESLDRIFAESYPDELLHDSLESKLFGIGSETFVVGSHEFYLQYALRQDKTLCLDTGHFHPTESVADKLSALLLFFDRVLLHLSRGLRWDSDHVVIGDDVTRELLLETVRCQALDRVDLALDYFDASISRTGAWVTGARAVLRNLLFALLEPGHELRRLEAEGDGFAKLALAEEMKAMPFGAVWDYHCLRCDVPPGAAWIAEVQAYEREVGTARA